MKSKRRFRAALCRQSALTRELRSSVCQVHSIYYPCPWDLRAGFSYIEPARLPLMKIYLPVHRESTLLIFTPIKFSCLDKFEYGTRKSEVFPPLRITSIRTNGTAYNPSRALNFKQGRSAEFLAVWGTDVLGLRIFRLY